VIGTCCGLRLSFDTGPVLPGGLRAPNLKPWRLPSGPLDSRFDAWAEKVSNWLVGCTDVSVGEVLVGALGVPQESWSQTAQNRVAAILVSTGFKRYRPGMTGQPRTPRYRREAVNHHGDLGKVEFDKKSG
jgi:hypothetical protein